MTHTASRSAAPRPVLPAPSRLDALWLALALATSWAAVGPWGLALAGWLSPLLTLRFLRARRGPLGYLAAWIGLLLVLAPALRPIIPIEGPAYYGFVAVTVLLALVPYLVDRLLAPRLPLWAGALAFPAAVTLLEYANGLGPYGSFGSSAYTQVGWSPVVQLAALGGLWAIVFLIHWVAAAGVTLWVALERRGAAGTRRALPAALPAALALVAAVAWGGARLALAPAPAAAGAATVAALTSEASLIADVTGGDATLAAAFAALMAGDGSAAQRGELMAAFEASNARLLERSAAAAARGAAFVLWAEGNAVTLPEGEDRLLADARALARRESVGLGVAVAVITPGAERPLENKLIVIAPDGAVSEDYLKANPVPGPEAASSVAGSESLLLADTPLGLAAGVICFDADFPAFMADAGRAGAELLLVPANDWAEIRRLHADMALFRAVENGAPLLRAASNGVSLAADAWGRVTAERDDLAPDAPDLLLAPLPTATVATLYPRIGDLVVGASLALLLALGGWVGGAGIARRAGARRRRAATA